MNSSGNLKNGDFNPDNEGHDTHDRKPDPDNFIDAINPYDEKSSTSDGQRKFRGYGTHGMSWSGGYNGQYPIYQTNGQYPANEYYNRRYLNGKFYDRYPENGEYYAPYPGNYDNNYDQNPGNYYERYPLPNGYHYGTAIPYDYKIHYAYPDENNYNQQYPGARDPPTNSRDLNTHQPDHFPGNSTPKNIPPTVVSSNQPKKVIFDWTSIVEKRQSNMTNEGNFTNEQEKLRQLYTLVDSYYTNYLSSKINQKINKYPQENLFLFGKSFSKPAKISNESASEFNHRYKKII